MPRNLIILVFCWNQSKPYEAELQPKTIWHFYILDLSTSTFKGGNRGSIFWSSIAVNQTIWNRVTAKKMILVFLSLISTLDFQPSKCNGKIQCPTHVDILIFTRSKLDRFWDWDRPQKHSVMHCRTVPTHQQ